MSQAFEQPKEQLPSYSDQLVFARDWEEQFAEHQATINAGMGAIRDIASDPYLSLEDSLARQARALDVVSEAVKFASGAAALAIVARARTAELFDIEFENR